MCGAGVRRRIERPRRRRPAVLGKRHVQYRVGRAQVLKRVSDVRREAFENTAYRFTPAKVWRNGSFHWRCDGGAGIEQKIFFHI